MGARIISVFGFGGAGKTTFAQYLKQGYRFRVVKFADPLKNMLRAIGLTDEHIEGSLKLEPCDLLQGKTPRQAMQSLGTEWGRDQIGENFWVDLYAEETSKRNLVVTDDMRFPNEVKTVLANGGVLIKITRPDLERSAEWNAHPSEQYIPFLPYHFEIINDAGLGSMLKKAHAAAATLPHEMPPLTIPEWPGRLGPSPF